MSEDKLFFKLHNGFPEHPKTIELSDKAFRQLVETWCFCSRTLNDGKLTQTQFFRFFSSKSRGEVLKLGFVVETSLGYEMHDYLEHQRSAQQVADLRERRRTAGSKGGKAKANGLASAKQMPQQNASKPLPDTDTDTDTTPNGVVLSSSPDATNGPRNSPGRAGTRIPPDFKPTPHMLRWAQDNAPNVDPKTSTRKFTAHYRSVSGRTQFKTDWAEAWKAWLIGDQEKNRGKPTTNDRVRAGLQLAERFKEQEPQSEIEAPK